MLHKFYKIVSFLVLILAFETSASFASSEYQDEDFDMGVTSLMNSVAANDYQAIEFFVKIRPLDINRQNIGGATALHLAVRNNDKISTKLLIASRANPNLKDVEGYTPAMRACFYGYDEIFDLLRKNSNIDFSQMNNDKDSFIILAALAKNPSCLQESLSNIIPLRDLSIEELKDQLNRAFIIAMAKDDEALKVILLKYLKKLQIFQQKIMELSQYDHQTKRKVIKRSVIDNIINTMYVLKEGYKGIVLEGKGYQGRQKLHNSNLRKHNSNLRNSGKKKYIVKKSDSRNDGEQLYKLKSKIESKKHKKKYKLRKKEVRNKYHNSDEKKMLLLSSNTSNSRSRYARPASNNDDLILNETLIIE